MPPWLAQDSALTQCPNFTSESYHLVCGACSAQRQAWLLQQEEDNRIRAVRQWLKDQEAAALRQKEEAEAEAEDITFRKKKPKMNDLNPQNQLVTPSFPTHLSMPWQSWAVPNGLNYSISFPRPAISLLKHIWWCFWHHQNQRLCVSSNLHCHGIKEQYPRQGSQLVSVFTLTFRH